MRGSKQRMFPVSAEWEKHENAGAHFVINDRFRDNMNGVHGDGIGMAGPFYTNPNDPAITPNSCILSPFCSAHNYARLNLTNSWNPIRRITRRAKKFSVLYLAEIRRWRDHRIAFHVWRIGCYYQPSRTGLVLNKNLQLLIFLFQRCRIEINSSNIQYLCLISTIQYV